MKTYSMRTLRPATLAKRLREEINFAYEQRNTKCRRRPAEILDLLHRCGKFRDTLHTVVDTEGHETVVAYISKVYMDKVTTMLHEAVIPVQGIPYPVKNRRH